MIILYVRDSKHSTKPYTTHEFIKVEWLKITTKPYNLSIHHEKHT